jgi:enoyl-CoA hydratase
LAAENAKFGQPEVNLGLIPGYGGTQRLTALTGKGKAMELCMTSAIIDAQEALRIGLVNHVFPAETLMAKTIEMLTLINTKAPLALTKVIQCVNVAGQASGFETEINLFGECFATADMKEGVSAFLEKRKASFEGA